VEVSIMRKVAILFRGAVGKSIGKLCGKGGVNNSRSIEDIYSKSDYVNFYAVQKSIKRHILDRNPQYECDFFIHCWNGDIQDELIDLYKPKKYLFEDNKIYWDEIRRKIDSCGGVTNEAPFGEVSVSLSIKKGCELLQLYCYENNAHYDLVFMIRPDYLYWKDMNFDYYNPDIVYGTQYGQLDGQSHYIMNYNNMCKFKNLYENLSSYCPPNSHIYMRHYLAGICGLPFKSDYFATGVDHESVRKLRYNLENGTLDASILDRYGLTEEEIYSYYAD